MEVVMRTSLRRSREAKRHRSRKHAFEIDFRCRTTDKGSQVRRAHLRWHKQPSLSQARVFCCPVASGSHPARNRCIAASKAESARHTWLTFTGLARIKNGRATCRERVC